MKTLKRRPKTQPTAIDGKWLWHYNALLSLRERLANERRNQLRDATEALEPHSMDAADSASDEFDRDVNLSELSAGQATLFEIDAALARIRHGGYGICEATGKKIPAARLRALPWTRFAKEAEARLEKTGAVRAPRLGSLPAVIGLLLVALAAFAGCATAPIPGASPGLLEFLQPGATTRQEAIVRLGQPSAAFEGESILTYRVGEDKKQGRYIVTPKALLQWQEVRYSLVLIFDGKGVLQKKSLVDVR